MCSELNDIHEPQWGQLKHLSKRIKIGLKNLRKSNESDDIY